MGNEHSRKLNFYTPAAMVGYFDELAQLAGIEMDPKELSEMASRYGMEVLTV